MSTTRGTIEDQILPQYSTGEVETLPETVGNDQVSSQKNKDEDRIPPGNKNDERDPSLNKNGEDRI